MPTYVNEDHFLLNVSVAISFFFLLTVLMMFKGKFVILCFVLNYVVLFELVFIMERTCCHGTWMLGVHGTWTLGVHGNLHTHF